MEIDSSLKADNITNNSTINNVININNANSNNNKNSLPDILSEYNQIINKQEKEIEKTITTKNNKQHTYFESQIEQSQYDNRKIKHLRFKSNFQVLLVSDSRTDKSAAAMNVNIGSLLDPKDYQGLAHFLEHMLFMGTDLFPNENEFDEFMNKNSGFSNAFTGDENTVFYYNINEKAFKDSLLRFSRFFIAPLFMESSVKREVKAVDSEYCDSKTNDFWREMQVKSQEKNENSVERCFGMGCKKTLIKDEIRNKVVEFYQKYYKSNMMSLVIVSKIDINALEEIVFDIFYEYFEMNSEVKEESNNTNDININTNGINDTTDAPETKETTNNIINTTYLISNDINSNLNKEEKQYYINSLFLPNFTYSKFEKEVLINNKMKPALSNNNNEHFPYVKNKNISQLYYIKPSASIHSLSIDFIIKKDHYCYPRNPVLAFITIILGHESRHSVTHLLKQLDLISDLSTSYTNNSCSYSMFSVTLKMTDKGFNNWELVLCLFFSYIEYFKKNSVNERYLDEFKYQLYQSFVYDNNISSDISDIAVDLTESFSYFNKENIISKDKIFYGRDCSGVFEFLNDMNFDNMNIYFSSKRTEYGHLDFSHEEFLTEKWYKVKYKKTAITEEIKRKWSKIIECLSRINNEKIKDNNSENYDTYNKPNFDVDSEVLKILRSNKESDINRINMDLFSDLKTNFNYPDKNDFISYNMKIKDYMNYKIRNTCKLSNETNNKDSEYNYYIDEESTIDETTKPVYPQLIKNTPLSKIFFKQDYVFKLPKVIIASKIYLNIDQFEKIKSKNLLALLLQLIEDELMDIIYKASDCETCISLSFSNNGINLLVNGFNDKILLVLSEFIKDLETKLLELKENLLNEKFAINKIKTKLENILKDKKLSLNDSPDDQANELLKLILIKENTWVEDDIKFLEDVYNNKMKYEEDDESSEEDSEGSDDSKDNNEDSKDEDEEEEEKDTSKELNDSKESKDSTNTKDSKEYEFVNPIKIDVLIEMIDSIFKEIKFNWLIQGNSTVEEAVVIINKAEELLIKMFNSISNKNNTDSENKEEDIKEKSQPIEDKENKEENEEKEDLNLGVNRLNKIKTLEKIAKYHILNIPKETELQYYFENRDKEEENYSTLVYYQIGNLSASISSLSTNNLSNETTINKNSIKLKKLLTSSILNSIMYDSFFDSLRTKQQIGYSVSCFLIDHLSTKGFIFLVKSSKLDSNEIYERINNFTYDFYVELIKKSEDYFVSYVNALLLELKNRFTCLEEETNYYWSLILNEKENTFDNKNLLINYLTENGISKEDVCCFYKEVFSENIKKVSVFVNPNKNVVEKLLKKKEKENNKNSDKENKDSTNNDNGSKTNNNKEICNEELSLNSNISVAQKLKNIIISDESNIKNEKNAENVLNKNDFLAKKRVRISSISEFKREYNHHYQK